MTRRLTTSDRENIRKLAEVLAKLLPASAHSKKAITFASLLKQSGAGEYLKGDSKKAQLQACWSEILRRHPKLPFKLIRKIVPAAVDYRRYKRNPLTRLELNQLAECLASLGIEMTDELNRVDLDETVPEIRVPSSELTRRLESHPLVVQIRSDPLQLFKDGHFNESIRKAAERFEVAVQSASGLSDIGKDLMARAFRLQGPLIRLNALATENDEGIQEGFMFLSMGAMRAIRNVFSHGDESRRAPEEAFEMLLFLNWMFRVLDRRPQTSPAP